MITRSTCHQFLTAAPVFLLAFLYGCKVGYTQAATKIFNSPDSPFPVSSDEISWIGSISFSGTCFSVIISYFIGDKLGRKTFIICCTLTYLLFWLSALTTSSGFVIVAGLFFYGISASMNMIIGNIYIGEIATPQNREIFGICTICANRLGTQIEYLLYGFNSYRLLIIFPLVVSILNMMLCIFCMVETPYFLVAKNKTASAKKTLKWLNDSMSGEKISVELKCMEEYMNGHESKKEGNLKTIFQPANFKLLLVMIYINGAGSFTVYPLMGYGSLLVDAFADSVDGNLFVVLYNISVCVACILSLFTIKIFNRRGLTLYGFIIVAVLELSCAYCYHYEYAHHNSIRFVAVVIEILLISISFMFTVTSGNAVHVLKTEIFPHKLKEFYSSALAFTSDLTCFIVTKLFYAFSAYYGIDKFFGFYSLVNIAAAFLVYFFISETKNKELHQIKRTPTDCSEK